MNYIPFILFILLQLAVAFGLWFGGAHEGEKKAEEYWRSPIKNDLFFTWDNSEGISRTTGYKKIKEILNEYYSKQNQTNGETICLKKNVIDN